MDVKLNELRIKDGKVLLDGFEKLGNCVTLNILPSGLTLINGSDTNSFCGHIFSLNENKESYDEELIQILKDRQLEESTYWLCIDNIYYESKPHRSLCLK